VLLARTSPIAIRGARRGDKPASCLVGRAGDARPVPRHLPPALDAQLRPSSPGNCTTTPGPRTSPPSILPPRERQGRRALIQDVPTSASKRHSPRSLTSEWGRGRAEDVTGQSPCPSLVSRAPRVVLEFARGTNPWRFESPEAWVSFMETAYGPTVKARAKRLTPRAAGTTAARRCSRSPSAQRGDRRQPAHGGRVPHHHRPQAGLTVFFKEVLGASSGRSRNAAGTATMAARG
jgi:hypothetical protein